MKYLIVLFFSISFFSCKSETVKSANAVSDTTDAKGTVKSANAVSDTTYLDAKGKAYKSLVQIPDSLRTQEQEKLVRAIEVIVNHISVRNNHMVLALTKEQFLAKGIPERYYKMVLQNIIDNNNFIDSNGIKNVDKMVKRKKVEMDTFYRSKNQEK